MIEEMSQSGNHAPGLLRVVRFQRLVEIVELFREISIIQILSMGTREISYGVLNQLNDPI